VGDIGKTVIPRRVFEPEPEKVPEPEQVPEREAEPVPA
jgi:hypothetical protein